MVLMVYMYFSLREIQVRGICGFFLSSQYCFAALPTDFDSDSDIEACQLRNESVHWSSYIYSLLSMIRFILSCMSKAVECSPLMLHSAAVYECFAHCVACRNAACFTTTDHQTGRPWVGFISEATVVSGSQSANKWTQRQKYPSEHRLMWLALATLT